MLNSKQIIRCEDMAQDRVEAPPMQVESTSRDEMTNGGDGLEPNERVTLSIPRAVFPAAVPEGADLDHPSLYFNRELGWLDFNWRVLYWALDERVPLLERVRFLAITASNLDEFVQKRVGGLKRQEAANVRELSPDGRTPTEQLALIREAIILMHQSMNAVWKDKLKPALREQAGIALYNYDELNAAQQHDLHNFFQNQIYPILTPLAVDPGRPFPFISNLSLSLAVITRNPKQDTTHFARLKVPANLARWLPVKHQLVNSEVKGFLPVEQLIAHHISELFYGMEIVGVYAFRVTRNADLRRDEEEAEDLLSMISDELRERRFAPVVRVEVEKGMPEYVRRILMRELGLREKDIYEIDGLLDLSDCFQIADIDVPHLKFTPWEPVVPRILMRERESEDTRDIFSIIRQGDLLVYHPYDSFAASVQRLIEDAAADEQVLAIKQTLYRTSSESPIVKALIRAAESGKQVAVLVEVKARFDEANNIEWGEMLENAGVHVAYGLVGLKTHTKSTLIVRKEGDSLRTYCHIGTGNYHPRTARLYTDIGLLTCSPILGRDIVNLFHYLTGYAPEQPYQKAIVAPRDMRAEFIRLIRQEIRFQSEYGNGRIIAKMNALDDVEMIQELYRASQAGVGIDLIIRGHSRLRPGLEGYSDNIRIISILGRFLEHDRILYFHNNDEPLLFIGSADWRRRNLAERVELVTPIEKPTLKKQLIRILEAALKDNRLVWDLDAHGYYVQRRPAAGETEYSFQEAMMEYALERSGEVCLL